METLQFFKKQIPEKKLFSFLVLIGLVLATPVFGVELYLEPSEGEYYPDDTFIVSIRLDTQGECINTVKAELGFPQDLLEAVDFSRGDSILTLWVENPQINQDAGLISFAGGIPGGYCGRIPGDPGTSNLFGKVIFRANQLAENRSPQVKFLDSSQVLLNDGKGTPAELTTQGAIFTILPQKPEEALKDEWQEELEKDKISPEPFVIEVRQDPEIFEGKYYLVFSTTDKQTGLDHYEILETNDRRPGNWKVAESPYLLEDQELQSMIKVKAIDKAGNERVVEVGPIKPFVPPEKKPFSWWIIILVVVGGAIIWRIISKFKKRSSLLKQT